MASAEYKFTPEGGTEITLSGPLTGAITSKDYDPKGEEMAKKASERAARQAAQAAQAAEQAAQRDAQ